MSQAKYAVINASASGDNVIVAAVAGKRIRVLGANFLSAGTVNATWKTGTASAGSNAALSGAYPLVAQAGMVLPLSPVDAGGHALAHMVTAVGEALNLNLSGAVLLAGSLVYELEN